MGVVVLMMMLVLMMMAVLGAELLVAVVLRRRQQRLVSDRVIGHQRRQLDIAAGWHCRSGDGHSVLAHLVVREMVRVHNGACDTRHKTQTWSEKRF